MSLRARLVLVLVVLAAGGLLVVGAATYTSQRSFQLDRVDDQTEEARPALSFRLDEASGLEEPRDDLGRRIGEPVVLSYGEDVPAPALPARLEPGEPFTVHQCLSDASHELRTPLASIRGYAELHRMGALRTPEDQAGAIRRIEDEAARMGVLVEDLLVLARLDELRAPVRTDVDLAALAEDAVADARHGAAAPDLRRGERRRGGRRRRDPARLFDRFWRAGGAGRQRGDAGAGLGLAIVGGIAAAHGGTPQAEDAPGGGATFVVELPAAERVEVAAGPKRAD